MRIYVSYIFLTWTDGRVPTYRMGDVILYTV